MEIPRYKVYKLANGHTHIHHGRSMGPTDRIRLDPARVERANLTGRFVVVGDSEDWSGTLNNPASDVVGLIAGIDSADDLYELRDIEEATRNRRDVLKAIREQIEQVI